MISETHSAVRRWSWLPALAAAAAIAAAAGLVYLVLPYGRLLPVVDVAPGKGTGPAMCPWRDPDRDLSAFFPGATSYRTDTLALSSIRQDILRRLGPGSRLESNSLYVHRALKGADIVGSILVRREAGPHGALEVVLAVDPSGKVSGVKIQRHREPAAAAQFITSDTWLKTFRSQSTESIQPAPPVPAAAMQAASVISHTVRTMLIELEEAERYYSTSTPRHH